MPDYLECERCRATFEPTWQDNCDRCGGELAEMWDEDEHPDGTDSDTRNNLDETETWDR